MKCAKTLLLLSLLWCWLPGWLSAQATEPATPVASESEPTPVPLSQQLRDLATTLEQTTSDSELDWELWSQEWTAHLLKLEALANLSHELERVSQSTKVSLEAFENSLALSIEREGRVLRKLAAWRTVALVEGGVLAAAALIAILVF